MIARNLIAVVLIVFLEWIPLPVQAVDRADEIRKAAVAQQRVKFREGLTQYPLITQHKIDAVFHLRADGPFLSLQPFLEPDHDYTQRRAELDGIPEPAVILCWLISQDLGQVQFELNLEDNSDPIATGHLHLLARPDGTESGNQLQHIELDKRFQFAGGNNRVLLRQVNSMVHFQVVQAFNDGTPDREVNLNFFEKDFVTLRRNHPAETERYLRPIFHELHQEAAFAADPVAAWQVLSDAWPVNEAVKDAVNEQIKLLNNDNFRIRQTAADQLQKLGHDSAILMMRMDRKNLSPEQNLRMDEVISRFKPLPDAEAKRLAKDPAFLVDCLYGEDPIASKLALDRLREVTSKPIELDLSATDEARIDAVDALREKLFPPPTTRP